MLVNSWILWAGRLQNYGLLPAVSPYHTPVSVAGAEQFRQLLRRHLDFDRIEVDSRAQLPALLLGAVDVLSGQFRAFNSRHDRITADTVLASAAIPNLFRAVPLDGALYWDGLFSQNPPVRELLDLGPDELWVIQINPQQRATEPTTLLEIADRRNELAGNLSLYQELAFIEKIDRLLESGLLNPGGKYKQVAVRVIELSRSSLPRHLGAESKLNRDPLFIRNLMAHGEDKAEEFLSALAFERAWVSQDVAAVMDLFAEDAELVSAAPFPERGSHLGAHAVRRFVEKHLATGVRVDSTRKQVARDRVTWTVRVHDPGQGTSLPGQVDAGFRAGKVADLRLGALPTAS
jgi:NTE family protein